MSYCRFRNTYNDLRDCQEALNTFNPDLNTEEAHAYKHMLLTIVDMLDDIGVTATSTEGTVNQLIDHAVKEATEKQH
jgi:hypothetical protein